MNKKYMSMRKYFRSPAYWIKLGLMFAALVFIRKYGGHYKFYLEIFAVIIIWGFNPERFVGRMVSRIARGLF